MADLAKTLAPLLAPGAVVTDAGSVKGPVVAELEVLLGGRFVGAHPMAGSEKSGIEAARADLFEGALCILTPTDRTHPAALEAVRSLWSSVGCRLTEKDPAVHDRAVGRVSHLPHAVAAVLVHAVEAGGADIGRLAGGGYRDTTRIAAGSAAMWSEIFLENRPALLEALEDFSGSLEALRAILRSNDAAALEEFLTRAKQARDRYS
jgi:prephenate dehydrogenase